MNPGMALAALESLGSGVRLAVTDTLGLGPIRNLISDPAGWAARVSEWATGNPWRTYSILDALAEVLPGEKLKELVKTIVVDDDLSRAVVEKMNARLDVLKVEQDGLEALSPVTSKIFTAEAIAFDAFKNHQRELLALGARVMGSQERFLLLRAAMLGLAEEWLEYEGLTQVRAKAPR